MNYKTPLLILFFILWAISLWFVKDRTGKARSDKAYWRKENFKPDTVYLTEYVPSIYPEYREGVKPKTVTMFMAIPPPKNFLTFQDSLLRVIDGLRGQQPDKGTNTNTITIDTVFIKPEFLQLYPKANKLLYLGLTKDTLTLDLLGVNGKIKKEVYPIDASSFKYQYRTNSLFAEEIKTRQSLEKPKKKPIFRYDGTFINYDRDLINQRDRVSATLGFDIKRIRVSGYTEFDLIPLTPQANNLRAGVKIGYRLF